ncbi:MAG: pyridoxal phosphate-dependent aminotransferase [Actinomycetaceae bacterium]|nr:pyridoxal phosphate-dependent aminotransferase [Actinomycetaceae bacterium]MDY6083153.1 pyridoxal phosphate-dependent aminotransferase [Actinomycetaceae bacterium]
MHYSQQLKKYGDSKSAIRELAAYGSRRAREIGEENVFDFSLGAPSVPAPARVTQTMLHLLQTVPPEKLHGYTAAEGDLSVREKIATYLSTRYGIENRPDRVYVMAGASAGLAMVTRALRDSSDDEFVCLAPFWAEYTVFIDTAGAQPVVVPPDYSTFEPDREAFEAAVNEHTKAVFIDQPNNPSGVLYREETLTWLANTLRKKEKEFGHPIYLIADEPYRELAFDGESPYMPHYYADTIIVYSFSKALSLAGERIGYIYVPESVTDGDIIYSVIKGAGRALGYSCAPALMQYTIAENLDITADISVYHRNRDLLYTMLTDLGFECVYPTGAFYMMVKSPSGDGKEFSHTAQAHDVLVTPSDTFGIPGYVRVSFCVSSDRITRSQPAFAQLAQHYGLRPAQ